MKRIKKPLLVIFASILILSACVSFALAATKLPSETSAFVTKHLIDETDVDKPFFEEVFPEVIKNIKESNKHSVTPFYDKFPVLNNPENFQGLGHATYANINGKTVTAEGLYRLQNEGAHDPNVGLGIMIYQCIQYKIAHPEEDVEIYYANYRTSVTYSVCVVPESKYYGYGRILYGTSYDEQGFVRLSYMLAEAARMGIKVVMVTQLPSYGRDQYDPTQKDLLRYRGIINHVEYFNKALTTSCYDKYAKGKKVSDYLNFAQVGWIVDDKTADMQHVKGAGVSHYIATDGTEHGKTIYMGSSNLDDVDYRGANANNGSQSGIIVSDHDELYRITKNYFELMAEYRGQEEMYTFRREMVKRSEEQIELIMSGRENEIPRDEQIVYLGSKNDPVFELYFTPFGGASDSWDTVMNPQCKYIEKLQYSEDYVEFIWNISGYGESNLAKGLKSVLYNAFCAAPSEKNRIAVIYHSKDDAPELPEIMALDLGREIGYRVIKDGGRIHAKDMFVSYVEDGVRHKVSLLTSCNYYMIAYNYRANSFLVVNETDESGVTLYDILAERQSFGLTDKELQASPANLKLGVGQTYDLEVKYTGKEKLTWKSSNTAVATVKNGRVTAVGKGSATITVSDGKNSYKTKLTVVGCMDCEKLKNSELTFSLDEQYIVTDKFRAMPRTFEAVFTVDKASLTGNATVIGNDGYINDAFIAVGLNKNGQPRVYLRPATGYTSEKSYVFKKVNVATGEKVHLTITLDSANKKLHCYVNGKLAQTISNVTIPDFEQKYTFAIGGDYRNGNKTFFPGVMKSVAVWSDVRTESEIATDYSKGADATDANLLASYNLARCEKHLIDDLSADDNDLYKLKLWLDKDEVEPVTDYEYSFAVIGDTQTMCEADPEAMESIYDWIVANKKSQKIEYVIGLGDITDDSTDVEWERANKFISKLNGVVPYVLTRGNHDDWDDFNRNLHNGFYENTIDGMMNTGNINLSDPVGQPGVLTKVDADGNVSYVTREEDVPEGGVVKGDITNSYRYFNVQGTDYLIMTLDFAPSDKVMEWASSVIEAHPDHKVIVITHAYMYRDGTTLAGTDCYPTTYYTGYVNAQDGEMMWEKYLSKHENVLMVLSGHDPWQHIAYRQDFGEKGNTVTQMLIDAQYVDRFIGSTAMIAMFYFSEDGKTLTVRYYSVAKDCYGSELSQFTVHLEHTYERVPDKKATLSANGTTVEKCSCGAVKPGSEKAVNKLETVTLSETSYTYNGKAQTPAVTVKDSKGNTLKKDTDYTVSFESGRKNPGKYTVEITFKGKYSGTKKLNYTIAPAATSSLTATQSASAIILNWSEVTGASGYLVYQYKSGVWKQIKNITSGSTVSCKVDKLTAGTVYKFRVRPYKTDEGTINGGVKDITTATKPAKVSGVSATQTTSAITLRWSKVAGADGYRVYQYNAKAKKWVNIKTLNASALSYKVEKLTAGTTCKFRIKAYKKVGGATIWGSEGSTFTTATKPAKVSGVSATQTTSAITLKWSKVAGADGYRIYQYNAKTKKWVSIKTVNSSTLSYKVKKLTAGTTYKFCVAAYKKAGGVTIWGDTSVALTTATKPAAPKISKLTAAKGSATLVWTNVAGESGYEVYCSTKKDSGFKKLGTYKADVTKATASKLTSGKTCYFKVRAYTKLDSGIIYGAWSPVKSVKIK